MAHSIKESLGLHSLSIDIASANDESHEPIALFLPTSLVSEMNHPTNDPAFLHMPSLPLAFDPTWQSSRKATDSSLLSIWSPTATTTTTTTTNTDSDPFKTQAKSHILTSPTAAPTQTQTQTQSKATTTTTSVIATDEAKDIPDEPLPNSRMLLAELIPVFQHTRKIMQKTVNQFKNIQKKCEGDAEVCTLIDLAVELLVSHRPPITASLNRIKLRLSAPDSDVVFGPPAPVYPQGLSQTHLQNQAQGFLPPETPTDAQTPVFKHGGKMDFPDTFHPDHATGQSKPKYPSVANSPSCQKPPKTFNTRSNPNTGASTPTSSSQNHSLLNIGHVQASHNTQGNQNTHTSFGSMSHQNAPHSSHYMQAQPQAKPQLSVSTDDSVARNASQTYAKINTPTWGMSSPSVTPTASDQLHQSYFRQQQQQPFYAQRNTNQDYSSQSSSQTNFSRQRGYFGDDSDSVEYTGIPLQSPSESNLFADPSKSRDFKSVPNSPMKGIQTTVPPHQTHSQPTPRRNEGSLTPMSAPAGKTAHINQSHIIDLLQRFCVQKFGDQICGIIESETWHRVANYLVELCYPNQQIVELSSKISKTFVDLVASSCMPVLSQLEPIDSLQLMQSIQALLQPWYASPNPLSSSQQTAHARAIPDKKTQTTTASSSGQYQYQHQHQHQQFYHQHQQQTRSTPSSSFVGNANQPNSNQFQYGAPGNTGTQNQHQHQHQQRNSFGRYGQKQPSFQTFN